MVPGISLLSKRVENNMLDQLLINLGTDGTTIITANAKQIYLHDHFLSENHDGLLNDVEITLIDKTDPSNP